MKRSATRKYLVLELLALCLVVPLAYRVELLPVHVLLLLWIAAGVCLVVLLRDPKYRKRQLIDFSPLRRHWKRIVSRWAVLCIGIALVVAFTTPDMLFSFVRQRPDVWLMVMLLYPILSVYPQGVIYRAFLLHRYRPLFRSRWVLIVVSAAAFGFMHIIFRNPVSVLMTLIGGAMFADTHLRSRSLIVSSVEHAMYGCFIFTIGWGRYFYHGAIPAS